MKASGGVGGRSVRSAMLRLVVDEGEWSWKEMKQNTFNSEQFHVIQSKRLRNCVNWTFVIKK